MAPKTKTKHSQLHHYINLALRLLHQSFTVGGPGVSPTFSYPALESKAGLERHGLATTRQCDSTILTHSFTDPLHWPAVNVKSWSAWLIPASSDIFKIQETRQASVIPGYIVAQPTTWWVLKDISGMPLHRDSRQLISSLTWKMHMKQPGNTAPFETFTGLASEADCLCLCRNITGTAESESESRSYSPTTSTQRKVFQLAMSSLWHVSDWRSMSCPHVLPGTSSEHYLWLTWQCFRGRSQYTIEIYRRQWMQFKNRRQGMASSLQPTNAKLCISLHPDLGLRDPLQDWQHSSASGGVNGVPWAVVGLTPLIHKAHQCAKDTVQGGSQPHPSDCSFEMGRGQRYTSEAVLGHCSLQVGCIVYGIASNIDLRQLDSIHNFGMRLALGTFCTSPVSSLCTEASEAPLEERRLKLSMSYYMKTCACIDNPAHHAMHEFDWTIRDFYVPRPNSRGGMTRPPTPPVGLKVEEAMASAEGINTEVVCPLRIPSFPPGTHHYSSERHNPIEGVNKYMIFRQELQAKLIEYHETQGSHDEVYTDGSKMNERVGAAAVINRHFQNGETTCRHLSKGCLTTAPSLLLRLQPSPWHWTITDIWTQFAMM